MLPLHEVIVAVEAAGDRLRAEFYRPQGPRGRRGRCPVDVEIEDSLRTALTRLIDCAFVGEETAPTPGSVAGMAWLVDPQDGTFDFSSGRRGSAISVALLRGGVPVIGVVHAPESPDRGRDTIAWAEGAGPIQRNGRPVHNDLSQQRFESGALVWATASSAYRPEAWSRAVAPARYVAMPSIAYRLARVAAGDGIATVSTHGLEEYDIAAGMALVLAAGGVVLDAQGEAIALKGDSKNRLSGCFAGAAAAAAQLARVDWSLLDQEPRREARISLGFPRRDAPVQRARAQGCLLGQVIGDSLGSLVEFKPASEMALTLARSLVRERGHDGEKVLHAYRDWLTSRPVDVGATTEAGLLGRADALSEANGSLMRVSPIGVRSAGEPTLAARMARDDSALTHPNEACLEACAAYCAAIAAGVGGAGLDEMIQAALAHSRGAAREAVERGVAGKRPGDFLTHQGWVLIALQNAFYCLRHLGFEQALVSTVGQGGDTDTNAAITGALLGAFHSRTSIPARWILPVLACRPIAEGRALRPRPIEYWPDDILDLAEALLV